MELRVRGGVQITRVGSPLRVDIEHHETAETTVFGDSCDCCHRWVQVAGSGRRGVDADAHEGLGALGPQQGAA